MAEAGALEGGPGDREGAGEASEAGRAVDAEHPWLGLDSFTEETRAYFYGRDREVAELARRVQRKLLTILFGQSGLGKTSILRAGLVPKLRPMGFCPVYVRIDYGAETPPPAEQIKAAIFRATREQGQWTQTGAAVEGESLWEFLHHRDDFLRDAEGRTVVPLLIFDQFEEIFTLAQADDAGRRRAAQFIEDLADLVENRPPKALEARIEGDESLSERFDFARADYRILIALREDYLAHLEGLKPVMPSITQNRMRLARMTGEQALAAVTKPGGRLVSEEVAESIVRFVAGGSELPNAEVEPSLLSLICRELNNARIAQARSEISVDLLAGSKETILAEFYERALADQPEAVRRFIEDEMLTESGFRESLGEERVRKAFNAAGAAPDALARLVDRRLLRVEERLDLRRVELTHDVLCRVVTDSRDLRHEREAKELAERELAAQKAREAAARKALVRARQVAAFCAILALGAVASALFGYQNMKRAQGAEAESERTRLMAQSARGEAEKLVVYLLDDFYEELQPIGQLQIVGDLAQRALAYYRELPRELHTPETDRNRALALVRHGNVLRQLGELDKAEPVFDEAFEVLDRLRRGGDASEATLLGLAMALGGKAGVMSPRSRHVDAVRYSSEALEVIKPLASQPQRSRRVRLFEGFAHTGRGFSRLRSTDDGAIADLRRAQELFVELGALELRDLPAATGHATAGGWLTEALIFTGQEDEAKAVAAEVSKVSNAILERRPGHLGAMRTKAQAAVFSGEMESLRLRVGAALPPFREAERAWEEIVRHDPSSASALNNLAVAQARTAELLNRLGHFGEALRKQEEAAALEKRTPLTGFVARNVAFYQMTLAQGHAMLGDGRRAAAAAAHARKLYEMSTGSAAFGQPNVFFRAIFEMRGADVALLAGDGAGALRRVRETLADIEAVRPEGEFQERNRARALGILNSTASRLAYRAGDLPSAQGFGAATLAAWEQVPAKDAFEQLRRHEVAVHQAKVLARLGRSAEAQRLLQPALAFTKEHLELGSDEVSLRVELAHALLVQSMLSPRERRQLLAQAEATIRRVPAEALRWKEFGMLLDEIRAEQAKGS
jgi:tetratricopeptide (TPR) repeat protein